MIQLDVRVRTPHLRKFVGGVGVVGWLTPTTYIELAGAGSIGQPEVLSPYNHKVEMWSSVKVLALSG